MAEWIDSGYNTERKVIIKKILEIYISWVTEEGKSGYKVTANTSRRLKNLFGSRAEAKKAAGCLVNTILSEIVDSYEEMLMENNVVIVPEMPAKPKLLKRRI